MKKLFSILALVGAAAVAPAFAGTITFDAPTTVSGPFDVYVNLTNVFEAPHVDDFFLAYGFDLTFDSTVLSYLGQTPGALFTDLSGNPGIGAQVAGVATNLFLAPGDFTEPLTLAILHFGVVGTGPTTLSISGNTDNPDQGLFYLIATDPISANLQVSAVSPSAVPEPGTTALLGAGLAVLGLVRKRR